MPLAFSEIFQQELPGSYLQFLDENPEGTQIETSEHDDARTWTMMGQAALLKRWTMKGVGEAANYECLKLYTHVAGENIAELYAHSAHCGPVKLDRVARGFVIGHENGDYLYLDPEADFSVWAYEHDGGEVTKISASFEQFLNHQIGL